MIIKEEVYMSCFDTMRMLHIYLPNDYTHSNKNYPVMYMYDGHNLFNDEDATYGKSWGMKAYLDHNHVPLIIVGIECNHEGTMRLSEFSPYSFHDRMLGDIEGLGNILMEWVVFELMPYIEDKYRVKKGREYTGIGGSSMGGLMSLYTILHHNDKFSKAACLSCYLDGVMRDIRYELKNHLHKNTKVYMSWGSHEVHTKNQLAKFTKDNLYVIKTLMKKGLDVNMNYIYRGTHCEACWEKEVPTFIRYLWK